MIVLTRLYHFPAKHILYQPRFDEETNRRIFDKCANPNGHGHNYELEVSVTGEPDPDTGQIVPIDVLDDVFDGAIRKVYSHTYLNDLEEFADLIPTAENIARRIHERLTAALAERSDARLARVRVHETARNHFDYGDDLS